MTWCCRKFRMFREQIYNKNCCQL